MAQRPHFVNKTWLKVPLHFARAWLKALLLSEYGSKSIFCQSNGSKSSHFARAWLKIPFLPEHGSKSSHQILPEHGSKLFFCQCMAQKHPLFLKSMAQSTPFATALLKAPFFQSMAQSLHFVRAWFKFPFYQSMEQCLLLSEHGSKSPQC